METKRQKEKLIERLENIQRLIPDIILAVKSLPDNGYLFCHSNPNELRVILDYDITEYRKYRRSIAHQWTFIKKHFNEYVGCFQIIFEHKILKVELTIDLQMQETANNQSCKLVVDYYELPEPVYKLECDK